MIAVYIGELVVRKLFQKMLGNHLSIFANTTISFVVILIGCTASFMVGWEVGFLMGKITGTIVGLSWEETLVYVPLMSFIYNISVSLIAGILFSVFVFIYLKSGNK